MRSGPPRREGNTTPVKPSMNPPPASMHSASRILTMFPVFWRGAVAAEHRCPAETPGSQGSWIGLFRPLGQIR